MKKSYSSLNILRDHLSGSNENKGFFKFLFTNHHYLTIPLPHYEYLRGKIFIQDLKDNFAEEISLQFSLDDLLYTLWDDFLRQIKKGQAKHEHIALYLIEGKKKYFPEKIIEKRIMKPITTHLFEFETVEEVEYKQPASNDEKTAYLTIRMRESELLRGEVLIHDLEPFLKATEQLTIEQVIAIVYLDFIEKIKKEGNSTKVQNSILAYLKS